MKKQVQKAKAKQQPQQPNQDILKLMALLGNKSGQSPDQATFLNLKEEKAKLEAENARKTREAKLSEQQHKNDEVAAKGEFDVKVAEKKRDRAKQKVKHTQQILEAQSEEKGLIGEIANLEMQNNTVEHAIEMKQIHGNIEKLKAQKDTLLRKLDRLKASIGYNIQSSPELTAAYNHVEERLKRFVDLFNEFEQNLLTGRATKVDAKLYKEMAQECEESMKQLQETNQRLKFNIDQTNRTIELNKSRIKRVQDLEGENANLEHQLTIKNQEAEDSGYVWNRDKEGNPIKVFDKSLLRTLVKPEDDKNVKIIQKDMNDICKYLTKNISRVNNGSWHDAILSNFEGYDDKLKEFRAVYKKLKSSEKLHAKKGLLKTFDEVIEFYKGLNEQKSQLYEPLKKKYDEDVEYNKKIESLPRPEKVKITDEMLYNQESKKNKLTRQLKVKEREISDNYRMEDELNKLDDEIAKLQIQIEIMPEDHNRDKLINDLVTKQNRRNELNRQLTVKNNQQKRVEKIQDDTADMEFTNAIDSKRLNESPRSKKVREDAEDASIKAKVAAEQANELNTQRGMTHKAERERRMAQSKENLMHSDEVKASEQRIEDEIVNRMKTEQETQRLEQLTNLEKQTRDATVTLNMKRRLNEHMQESTGIDDALTQLVVIKDQAIRDGKHYDEIKSKARKHGDRFRTNPHEFERYNIWAEYQQKPTYANVDELIAQTETDEHIGVINEFFDKWDGGYFEDRHQEQDDEEEQD